MNLRYRFETSLRKIMKYSFNFQGGTICYNYTGLREDKRQFCSLHNETEALGLALILTQLSTLLQYDFQYLATNIYVYKLMLTLKKVGCYLVLINLNFLAFLCDKLPPKSKLKSLSSAEKTYLGQLTRDAF